jgi:uncharacterized membrane protein (DUF2068 family)
LPVPRRTTSLRAVTTTPSRGLSVVVAYKLGKAAIELSAVVAVLVLHAALGRDAGALSARIERHWLHGIGAVLADLVHLVARAGDARLIVVALGGDALTSAVEGILLWRGYSWARWVVLGSTGLPLPWELVRLVRQPSVVRLMLLLVNGAILGWVWWAGPGAEARAQRARRHRLRRSAIAAVAAVGAWLLMSYRLIPMVERHRHLVAAAAPAAGRTTDASGYPADPVNVGLIGEVGELQLAMQRAGWLPARPITVLSTLGIFGAITLGRSDARAPVSDLFLDGRRQDLAFERQVGASPRRRHHARFWEQGQRVDEQTLWLGAATFDEGVTIARADGQLTHRTSPNIDEERDKLVGDLERGGCAGAVHDTPGIGARAGARTAEGRLIETDGRVAIVELGCRPER